MLTSCACIYGLFALFGTIDISISRPALLEDEPKPSNLTKKYFRRRSTTINKPVTVENQTTPVVTGTVGTQRGFFGPDYSDQEIIFPDSFEVVFDPIPKIDTNPKCAGDSTFCERFDYYPYHQLKEILRREHVYKDLFGADEAPTEIANRLDGGEEMFVCAARSQTIFPKIGKTKSNKWKFIINQGEEDGYIQGVRIETCKNHGGPCDIISDLPTGYTTSCRQKYVYRRLLSLNDNGRPIPDTFQLPSACCCAYKRDMEFLARFGKPGTTPR